MKYFRQAFLGLISLGFLGLIAGVAGVVFIFSYYGRDLPDYTTLKNYEPPIVTRLYAGDGRLFAEFAQEKRVFVPIEFIPEQVKQAFIAAEDQNFYSHSGVDLTAVARAIVKNLKNVLSGNNRRPEGASTITQQVAKNFFFSSEVSYIRKIKEAILSYRMNETLGKDHILELYLNQIYLGGGAYGVAAAAQYYFDKALEDLEIDEVAYLAILPKAPNNYHPVRNHDKALERRNWALDRMADEGYITKSQADIAKLKPLTMAPRNDENVVNAPYFAEEVRRELSDRYGEDSLYGGGLVVRTSVDPRMQAIAAQTLRDGLMAYDMRHGWRGPLKTLETMDDWRAQLKQIAPPLTMLPGWSLAVVLEANSTEALLGFAETNQGILPLEEVKWAREYKSGGYALGPEITGVSQVLKTGDVIMVEPVKLQGEAEKQAETQKSQSYALRQVPLIQGALIALDPHTGRILAMQGGWKYEYGSSEFNRATQAMRQPGSAFKPFVYLAALDKGFTPATLVLDAPFVLEDRPGNTWKPTNYSNEFYGPTPLRIGIEKSRNLMTVRLADFLGMDLIAQYANRFGITENMPPLLANSLGSAESTVLRMTAAYGMLVNGGKKITPTFIDRIQDRHGKTIFKHDQRPCNYCGDMIKWDEQAVPDIPDVREQIADSRTAFQIVSILEGVVERGTGVRIRSLGRPLAGKTGTTNESRDAWFIGFSPDLVVGVYMGFDDPHSLGKKETGSSVAVPVFKDFMAQALKDEPIAPFLRPPGIRSVQVNAETGARAKPGDQKVIWESFVVGTEPTDDIYILDGDGISLLQGYGAYDYNQSRQNGGTGYVPSGVQPSGNPSSATTGTGGLY